MVTKDHRLKISEIAEATIMPTLYTIFYITFIHVEALSKMDTWFISRIEAKKLFHSKILRCKTEPLKGNLKLYRFNDLPEITQ